MDEWLFLPSEDLVGNHDGLADIALAAIDVNLTAATLAVSIAQNISGDGDR